MSKSTEPARLTVGVSLQGLTWASLRRFVELCEEFPGHETVGILYDDVDTFPVGLEEQIDFPPAGSDG